MIELNPPDEIIELSKMRFTGTTLTHDGRPVRGLFPLDSIAKSVQDTAEDINVIQPPGFTFLGNYYLTQAMIAQIPLFII